jgi:hypothetical protein
VADELERPGQTRYLQLVDDEEHDRLDRMMTSLQRKDELAQRLEAIKQLEVLHRFFARYCSVCLDVGNCPMDPDSPALPSFEGSCLIQGVGGVSLLYPWSL